MLTGKNILITSGHLDRLIFWHTDEYDGIFIWNQHPLQTSKHLWYLHLQRKGWVLELQCVFYKASLQDLSQWKLEKGPKRIWDWQRKIQLFFQQIFLLDDWALEYTLRELECKDGVFYKRLKFSKADRQNQAELCFPEDRSTGEFYLSCMFGSGTHSRCVAILSKI